MRAPRGAASAGWRHPFGGAPRPPPGRRRGRARAAPAARLAPLLLAAAAPVAGEGWACLAGAPGPRAPGRTAERGPVPRSRGPAAPPPGGRRRAAAARAKARGAAEERRPLRELEGGVARRRALTACVAAALVGAGRPAQASFGPASGALSSPPPVRVPDLDELLGQPSAKYIQRLAQFGKGRVDALLEDLAVQRRKLEAELGGEFDISKLIQGKSSDKDDALVKAVGARYEDILKSVTRQIQLQQALSRRQERLQQLEKEPEWFNYLAAFIAAVVSTLVVHPIDTIKTRIIASEKQRDPEGPATPVADVSGDKPFQLADVPDLYKGVVGNIVKEGPSSALYLGVYEAAKSRLLSTPLGSSPLVVYLISGAVGEFFGSVVRAPAEAVKTGVQSGQDASTLESARRVVGTEDGRAKVFAAWSASLWRDIPFGAVQLAVFEGLKSFIVESPDIMLDVDSLLGEALLGAIGGSVGALVSVPTDVVTTRIITQDAADGAEPLAFGEMAGRIWEEEGPQGFSAGWKERVLYWGPAVSLFLTTYCLVRQTAVPLF